jgi:hypothetical protein
MVRRALWVSRMKDDSGVSQYAIRYAQYELWPSGGMADAGDLKSPARIGRVGSNPTSAIFCIALGIKGPHFAAACTMGSLERMLKKMADNLAGSQPLLMVWR